MRDTKYLIFKYVALVACLFLILDVFIQYQLYQRYQNDQKLSVYHRTAAIRADIEKEINSNLLKIQGIADYVSFHPELNKNLLDRYCEGKIAKSGLITNISIAPDYIIRYVYPRPGNDSVLGFDYRFSAEEWKSVKKVHDTREMIVSGPIDLAQGGSGLIGWAPVIVRTDEYFWGTVSAVLNIERIFAKAGLHEVVDLNISMRTLDEDGVARAVFYGEQDFFDEDSGAVLMQVAFASGTWEIAAIPVKGWGIVPPGSLILHAILLLFFLTISYSIYKTITKNAEVEMVKTSLDEAQSIAHLGNWSMDLLSGKIWWSNETYQIFGLIKGEYTPSKRSFFSDLLYHKDRKLVSDTYLEAMTNGEQYSIDHRIVRPDGEIRYVSERGRFSYDEEDNPVRVYGTVHDITDRKLIEEELRESKVRFDHVTKKLSRKFVFFSHTIDGEFIRLSEGLTHLGYGSPEVGLGRSWKDLFDFTPESLAIAEKNNSRIISGEVESTEYEMEFITPDGQERCVSVHEYLAYNFELETNVIEGVVLDITERKAWEERLKILTRAIENALISVVITDTNGAITYVNPYFCNQTGYSKEEALGQNPRILKSGEHDDLFYQDMWATLLSGETWRGEVVNKKKDGQLYWELASISPVYNEKGEVVSYVAVKDNIDDQKELERLKADVDLIMRHDLKTPLNGIIGLPGLLLMDDNLTKQQYELIKTIENSGKNMLHMIDMSLDMFKMETGKFEYYPLQVDIISITQQVIDNCKPKISAQKVEVEMLSTADTDITSGIIVWGEERLIYSLLSGLLSNAIEASPSGEKIVIEFKRNGGIVISVRNCGVVPEPIRGSFFQKYVTHGKNSGTGLGTYSAKLMAEAMHYGIEMITYDELNETVINITIPGERPE